MLVREVLLPCCILHNLQVYYINKSYVFYTGKVIRVLDIKMY